LTGRGTPILLGYSLGKSQEILANLRGAGLLVMLHSSIAKLVPVYEAEGIALSRAHAMGIPKTPLGMCSSAHPPAPAGKSMRFGRRSAAWRVAIDWLGNGPRSGAPDAPPRRFPALRPRGI
jgi:hypothetical protein